MVSEGEILAEAPAKKGMFESGWNKFRRGVQSIRSSLVMHPDSFAINLCFPLFGFKGNRFHYWNLLLFVRRLQQMEATRRGAHPQLPPNCPRKKSTTHLNKHVIPCVVLL